MDYESRLALISDGDTMYEMREVRQPEPFKNASGCVQCGWVQWVRGERYMNSPRGKYCWNCMKEFVHKREVLKFRCGTRERTVVSEIDV